jgi:hypothetical protein
MSSCDECKFLLFSKADVAALGYEDGREEKLIADKKQLTQEVHNLQEKLEKLEARWATI